MSESLNPDLLARYLAGEASPAQRAEVESWAKADPAHRAELDHLRTTWAAATPGEWDVDRAWSRVAARLDEVPTSTVFSFVRPPHTWRLALAAMLILAIGTTFVLRRMAPSASAVAQVLATLPGQQETINLGDGTRITLAAGSELRVAADYGRTERRVDLSGEAWFEVAHDADRPFRVYAAGTVTEDLGTEFTVRARVEESVVRVVVVSGSASLRREAGTAAESATLGAMDVATLEVGAIRPSVQRAPDARRLVAWHEGRMVFDDARLDSVVTELSRWYGMTILIADPALGERLLTGTFQREALDDAIDVLNLSLGVEIQQRADTLVIQ